jgi:glycosyltransferase involved in cell wall biosynthesis
MSNFKEILIWLPLPPHASWRGEGIAQTIENLLKGFSNQVKVNLVVSKNHYWDVKEEFAECSNISVHYLSFKQLIFPASQPKKFSIKYSQEILLMVQASLKENFWFWRNLKRVINFFEKTIYIITLYFYTLLQKYRVVFRSTDLVWNPIPAIPFSEKLSGNRVTSFWDPFVFEYREFESIAPYLMFKFLKLFKDSKLIFTQSLANYEFLTRVMMVNPSKVIVINNGAPDYSEYVKPNVVKMRESYGASVPAEFRSQLITEWLPKWMTYSENKIINQMINSSVLFRLSTRISDHSKILMVSTQDRPYKGISALFKLYDSLLKQHPEQDFLFVITAKVPYAIRNKYSWFCDRVFEVTRVPNSLHAHLYLLSDLVLHPSFSEGGIGAYPQYESSSLGIPSLINQGRHSKELIQKFPDISLYTTDFCDLEKTIKLIITLIGNEGVRAKNIASIKSSRFEWSDAARSYEESFLRI